MKLPKSEPKRARIEIVPMIDAIFFLLVFFMYSSLSMVKMNGLPMALPQSPGSKEAPRRPGPAKDAPHLMVVVGAENSCTVGGRPVAQEALAATVQDRLGSRPETLVVVQTEPGSGIQRLVDVMDALNGVRLKDNQRPTILIATEAVTQPDKTVSRAAINSSSLP